MFIIYPYRELVFCTRGHSVIVTWSANPLTLKDDVSSKFFATFFFVCFFHKTEGKTAFEVIIFLKIISLRPLLREFAGIPGYEHCELKTINANFISLLYDHLVKIGTEKIFQFSRRRHAL